MLRMTKLILAFILALCFVSGAYARDKYEYKIVPLGSLTSLQKNKEVDKKTEQLEALLNKYGADGWEVAEIFAVRTTFDPNVFFVIMKREI